MTPWSVARIAASLKLGVQIELVVPDHVEMVAIIHLCERRSDRIIHRIADAAASLFERRSLIGRIDELLAETSVVLHFTAKDAIPLSVAPTVGERCGVELEDKSPVDAVSLF